MTASKPPRFRFTCPRCGKAEVDRFLKACFSCWLDMSSYERRELRKEPQGSANSRGTPLKTVQV